MIISDGKTSIGAYHFPDRKKPCLCIGTGAFVKIYGSFKDEESAKEFMDELAEFFHVPCERGIT